VSVAEESLDDVGSDEASSTGHEEEG
jgi:hypothetical protein